ncbi:MAG: hypothetical protein IPH58_17525 [Sphingobacteriales bacterium]|jgi:hypothetical protein|nr:hypothetical protein [Sphingobacteriales bacterium]
MKRVLFLLIVVFGLIACSKQQEDVNLPTNAESIIGNWLLQDFKIDIFTYNKTAALVQDRQGITFKNGGKLVETKNSGFCGTPPITYAQYEGEWILNQKDLTIQSAFWGGKMLVKYEILELTKTKLSLKLISSN